MNWLDHHLKTFVKPRLGFIPKVDPDVYCIKQFTPPHLLALKTVWDEAKKQAGSRYILLAGRDVFLFEILARIEGSYTIYRPDISSNSVVTIAKNERGTFERCFLLDTGNKGTVPIALGIKDFKLIYYSGSPISAHQLFPKIISGPIYNLYTLLEGCPKYHTQAKVNIKGKVVQFLENDKVFAEAAMLTQHVARFFIEKQPKVISVGRGL